MAGSTEATVPFSARLRAETAAHHRRAEASPFVDDLLAGRLPLAGYAALAGQHWFVYDALERVAGDWAGHGLVGPFLDPRLQRLPHLERDLAFLFGADWHQRLAPLPATRRYVARIEQVGRADPAGFLAHHYTRYLGDVSGGQAIAATLRRRYGLVDGHGTAFYRFEHVRSPGAAREDYRARLDAAPLRPVQQRALIAEARAAYRCNTELFADLGARHLERPPVVRAGVGPHERPGR